MRRDPVAIVLASMLIFAASAAQAVGFGRVDNATVLGQPLDFYAAVVLGADEVIEPDCISVDVQSGDNPLPPNAVQVRIVRSPGGGAPRLRVQSTVRIDEPVVTVQLNVSCGTRLTRRFVVLVDPPTYAVPQVVAGVPGRQGDPAAAPTAPAPSTASRPPRSTSSGGASARPRDASRTTSRTAAKRPRRTEPRTVVLTPAVPAASAAAAASAPPVAVAPRGAATPRSSAAASAAGAPRLVLDGSGQAPPMTAAAPASSISEADAFAAEMARERERLKVLEATVDRLRSEQAAAMAQQAVAASAVAVPTRVREPSSAPLNPMHPLIYALLAAVALLLLAVIALMWQQARLRRQVKWWADAAAESRLSDVRRTMAPPVPESLETLPPRRAAPAAPVAGSVAAPFAAPSDNPPTIPVPVIAPLSVQRAPEPVGIGDVQVPARELSVEELMDLEQQADFFVVLGQDDAAVDLLMNMVRTSGGSSPMPYLKLLEIYRRTGERGPYDRIRERFNQRFNGTAPAWEQDPASGLELEAYPEVMSGLQALWPSPLEAAVSLEAMLFRRGGQLPPFDLPAFDELLFLHRLSHDLFEQERSNTGGVDLLLPLDSTRDAHLPITLDLQRPFDPSGLVDFESMPQRNR